MKNKKITLPYTPESMLENPILFKEIFVTLTEEQQNIYAYLIRDIYHPSYYDIFKIFSHKQKKISIFEIIINMSDDDCFNIPRVIRNTILTNTLLRELKSENLSTDRSLIPNYNYHFYEITFESFILNKPIKNGYVKY